eukprot:42088-Eustigmatos_ZCMA.PRE.1
MAEVPHVPLSGQEVMTDKGHGLSSTIYFEAEKARQDGLDKAQAFRMRDALVKDDGRFVAVERRPRRQAYIHQAQHPSVD